jgi:DNA invertase Pin-like site-specific DNA recombinase
MRCAIYARVSTRDKGQDPENQLAQLREYCQRQGWEIVSEFVDHATGKNGDRDQFKAMFEAAYQRKFDVLLFWSLDRFTREGTLPTLKYLERLDAYGVAYRSYTESWLDSLGPFKDVVLALLATLAKQETARIRERVIAGMERAKARGAAIGRPSIKRQHDKDAKRIRELREDGQTYQDIADELGRSKSTVVRIARTMNCAPSESKGGMMV